MVSSVGAHMGNMSAYTEPRRPASAELPLTSGEDRFPEIESTVTNKLVPAEPPATEDGDTTNGGESTVTNKLVPGELPVAGEEDRLPEIALPQNAGVDSDHAVAPARASVETDGWAGLSASIGLKVALVTAGLYAPENSDVA